MTEPKVICTVDFRQAGLDDDYTLYEDGQVKHFYDRNMYSLNHEDWLEAKTLSDNIKQKFLDTCPEELKEKARKLLYPYKVSQEETRR
ncbi:MAG: hypothetical protein VKL59_03320 [Nostocaceae cyanobacterium]|nr:hypothetical protein [Nostocaceae cyanobacterium]